MQINISFKESKTLGIKFDFAGRFGGLPPLVATKPQWGENSLVLVCPTPQGLKIWDGAVGTPLQFEKSMTANK